jgi:hypothetical protein
MTLCSGVRNNMPSKKNYVVLEISPYPISNIDECSTSEALDDSVPGAWLG